MNKFISLKKLGSFLFFLILCTSFYSVHANASAFFFAPSVGYQNFNLKLQDNNNIESTTDMNSPVYGLKLGVQSTTGVSLAVSGSYASGQSEMATGQTQSEYKYNHTKGAIQIGLKPQGVVGIYIGYLLYNELKTFSDTNDTRLKGPGYQLGLELGLTRQLNLGLQYELYQFKEMSMSVAGGEYTDIKNYFKNTDTRNLSAFLIYYF